jgi:Domain of unknown function (DUF4365)
MPLPREHLLDELATAYVHAIAATAGATIAVSRREYGIDGTLHHITKLKEQYVPSGFPIEFQLKGTTAARIVDANVIFDFKVRNYNLVATRHPRGIPLYLFLVCFGSNADQWVVEEGTQLTLGASAYWWMTSDAQSRNVSSVRIRIPVANRLTSPAIEDMLQATKERFER